jgi:hypothetical protein
MTSSRKMTWCSGSTSLDMSLKMNSVHSSTDVASYNLYTDMRPKWPQPKAAAQSEEAPSDPQEDLQKPKQTGICERRLGLTACLDVPASAQSVLLPYTKSMSPH